MIEPAWPDRPGYPTVNALYLAAFLALCALATVTAGVLAQRRISQRGPDIAREKVETAIEQVQEQVLGSFGALETSAHVIARQLEQKDVLARLGRGDERAMEDVVRLVANLEIPDNQAVEVYDPVPTLLAWQGPSYPLDDGPREVHFLSRVVYSVATDLDKRVALVLWMPVRDGRRVVGAVRLLETVENRVPLKNEYLKDTSWSEEMSRMTGLEVQIELFRDGVQSPDARHLLSAPDGTVIGGAEIQAPEPSDLEKKSRRRYVDVFWFWIVLILVVLTGAGIRFILVRPLTPGQLVWALVFLGCWLGGIRVLLSAQDIPGRWQQGKAPLAPLFDPQHLASGVGFGVLETTGELVVTACLALLFSTVTLAATSGLRSRARRAIRMEPGRKWDPAITVVLGVHLLLVVGLVAGVNHLAGHAVVDSTLSYFDRSGLMPDPLVLTVFAALMLLLFAALSLGARLFWVLPVVAGVDLSRLPGTRQIVLLGALPTLMIGLLVYLITDLVQILPWPIAVAAVATTYIPAFTGPLRPPGRSPLAALRLVVPLVVVLSLLLYPMLQTSADQKRRLRIQDAAATFLEERDARVMFAITQILNHASRDDFQADARRMIDSPASGDSLATALLNDVLFAGLESHQLTVSLHRQAGDVVGRHTNTFRRLPPSMQREADALDYSLLRAMYDASGQQGAVVEKITGTREQDRFRYAGFVRVLPDSLYLMIRAEQNPLAESGTAPFPRVLVPAGYFGDRYVDLSIAEFRDGILIRSRGQNFGRIRLDPEVEEALRTEPSLWRKEQVRDETWLTYYLGGPDQLSNTGPTVIAVRDQVLDTFDHLFFLLRIIVAGLLVALPIYFLALVLDRRARPDGAKSGRFRDRVLNAFFAVGTITVIATGFVGMRVVTAENERAVEVWLRRHLENVIESLHIEAEGEELPYSVLERISVDSLALRTGLDINIYHGRELERTSRPQLIRDRLIEDRLPIRAYEMLYFDGFRFITIKERLGTFSYTAGYAALTDERGIPHFVLSIPTLPEQERLEEERARTVAYLFGALLLLMLVVMVTASLLADALTRPIARMRSGLHAVAAGRFERIKPLGTGDELDQLVDSFNSMQDQLEDSRELLAQQERQLAWREMARQVAHEIKNPLTPMKLSLQHLRTAFNRRREDGSEDRDFSSKFNRTTTTLIEQIDTLARIANEFSSFGRMPTHVRERVDLNEVIREACELMRAEENVEIDMHLSRHPLVVCGDREALRRMYINFLKNALQAVPEERQARIRLESARGSRSGEEGMAVSRVIDNGSGISMEHRDQIFVPSFSTKTSGTGLGLAIARKTVESMDGSIGFETAEDEGTTFRVLLPLAEEH